MLRFDKAMYLLFLLKSILSAVSSNSLWGSDVSHYFYNSQM